MHSGHLSTLASSSPTSGGFGLIGEWPASYSSLRRFAMRARAAWSSATRSSFPVSLISSSCVGLSSGTLCGSRRLRQDQAHFIRRPPDDAALRPAYSQGAPGTSSRPRHQRPRAESLSARLRLLIDDDAMTRQGDAVLFCTARRGK